MLSVSGESDVLLLLPKLASSGSGKRMPQEKQKRATGTSCVTPHAEQNRRGGDAGET